MTEIRPLHWVGSSKEDLIAMPDDVRNDMGFALYLAQIGMKSPDAKPLKGMGSGVLEVVESDKDGTYRAVYTVRLKHAV